MYKFVAVIAILFFMCGCAKKETDKNPPPKPADKKVSYYTNETVGYKVPISKNWVVRPADQADLLMVSTDGSFSPDPSMNIQSVKQQSYDLWDKKNQSKIKSEIGTKMKPASEANITFADHKGYNLVYGLEKDGVSMIVDQTYIFHKDYFVVITCGCREEEYNRFKDVFAKLLKDIIFF